MRGPNSQRLRGHYVLPLISDILVKQGANQILSILDLREAFHQQPMHPDSRHITCTYTPFGIVQWRVDVMGLMNASGKFQQMMSDRLLPVSGIADPYIDDIMAGSKIEGNEDLLLKHDKEIREVLDLLNEKSFV